jgi:general secretion pathway protein H
MRFPSKGLSAEGFTLLELIVVLVILGIAMTIGTISINRAYQKSTLKDEALRVQGTLRHARDSSLIDRMPVTFMLEEEAGQFWLERDGKVFGRVRKVPMGLAIEGESIVFMPKGNSTGGVVIIKRSKQDRGYVIEVDKVTGVAKIRRL